MSVIRDRISSWLSFHGLILALLVGFILLSVAAFLLQKDWLFLALPFVMAGMAWGLKDFRVLYLMIWMTIPFAFEMDLPGGLSTDFPAEPLMWACCVFLPVYLYLNRGHISYRFIFHPLFILLFIHFSWIVFTTLLSQEPMISLKYTLAKSW